MPRSRIILQSWSMWRILRVQRSSRASIVLWWGKQKSAPWRFLGVEDPLGLGPEPLLGGFRSDRNAGGRDDYDFSSRSAAAPPARPPTAPCAG